ncbi:MAG: hypothetical protein AAFX06_18775 [Planctomycetota bacterium]
MKREPSTETVLRSRLLPRVSFQTMLMLPTIASVVFAIAFAANQGADYARAATAGMIFLAVFIGLGVVLFLAAWAASQFARRLGIAIVGLGTILMFVRLVIGPVFMVQVTGPLQDWLGPLAAWAAEQLVEWPWLINLQVIGWVLICFPIGVIEEESETSPFAEDQLPPQILAPRDPVQ